MQSPPGFGSRLVPVYLPYRWRELMQFVIKRAGAREAASANITQTEEFLLAFSLPNPPESDVDDFLRASGVFQKGEDAITAVLNPNEKTDRFGILDAMRRYPIRTIAALLPYGYPIADFLCQQYGMNSRFLDATLSAHVAAFFATHEFPCYLLPSCAPGVGVIYRLDATQHTNSGPGCEIPAYILPSPLFSPFEHDDVHFPDAVN
jgi:hypothetical protein